MELIYDIDINVKGEAIRLVFKLAKLYSAECVKTRLVNLFLELISTHNEELAKKVSFLLGEILTKLDGSFTKSSGFLTAAIKSFREYGQHKNDEIRRNFALNLIPIIQTIEAKIFLESFKGNFLLLMLNDKNKEIRLICLGHLPIIFQKIGLESSHRDFKVALMKLMKEDDKEILKKIAEILDNALKYLIPDSTILFEDMITVDFLKNLFFIKIFFFFFFCKKFFFFLLASFFFFLAYIIFFS